ALVDALLLVDVVAGTAGGNLDYQLWPAGNPMPSLDLDTSAVAGQDQQTDIGPRFVLHVQAQRGVVRAPDARGRETIRAEPSNQVEVGTAVILEGDRGRQDDGSFDQLRLNTVGHRFIATLEFIAVEVIAL